MREGGLNPVKPLYREHAPALERTLSITNVLWTDEKYRFRSYINGGCKLKFLFL